MLDVTPAERSDLAAKLSDIVRMVDELQAVDTAGTLPMAHPLDRPQRLREDAVTEQDGRALYQRNAPLVEQDLYLVPRVIE
jgi:aspartyl-tRNA(Asn)/glutamyl-tRNA(Gln) amidotransferase subunit C